jgi:uncharacterized protein (TIGR00369 family)
VGSSDERARTVTWTDPKAIAAKARGMAGLDFLRAMAAGEVPPPPIALLLGFGIREIEDGRVVFSMVPDEHHYNPIGMVHGGVFGTLLDTAMGCAVMSTLPAGEGYTTLEYKVNLTRAMTTDTGEVACEGRIVTRGRQTAVAEARIVDGQGRVCAHATSTCLVFAV